MRTKDLFKLDRSARRINESIEKVFGKKLNLESFDLDQLQDARNKIRTQLSQQRGSSGFNENIENDAYTKAQWMLDAINAEISHREEFIVDDVDRDVEEGAMKDIAIELGQIADEGDVDKLYAMLSDSGPAGQYLQDMITDITADTGLHPDDDIERIMDIMMDRLQAEFGDPNYNESNAGPLDKYFGGGAKELTKGLGIGGQQSPDPKDPNLAKAYRMGNAAQKAGNKDALNTIPKQYKEMWIKGWNDGERFAGEQIELESIDKDNEMTKLRESEIDQASAIVTANTMVDRLGRWIEELSGMENETLLQLGDSIRDEMGQEQSRQFIEAVAPTIQSALENLKTARESVSGAVRSLATGESPDAMLGAPEEPGMDMADPDAMNAGDELDIAPEMPEDDFDAAEPAAGGLGTAGREKRESIDFQGRLLKVLAG
jgi:hypothetical protein